MISPYDLLQEQQVGRPWAPWRVLVCQLLNRTHGRQVRPIVDELFENYPTPGALCGTTTDGEKADLLEHIRPLGFANQRLKSLAQMSGQYWDRYRHVDPLQVHSDGGWARDLAGCGQYAVDSINVFFYDKLENVSSDTWLQKYVDWRRAQLVRGAAK